MASGLIPHPRALSDGLAAELARIVGERAGTVVTASAVPETARAAWVVDAQLDGDARGTIVIGVTHEDAAQLLQLAHDPAGEGAAAEAGAALGGLWQRVVAAFAAQPIASGVTLTPGPCRPLRDAPVGEAVCYRLRSAEGLDALVTVWAQVERAAAPGPAAGRPGNAATAPGSAVPANLDVILDIDLPLSVRFGETSLPLDAVTRLGPGSVIDFSRAPDDPVDVLVNGRLVARGEVVVVGGNYGVRIVEVVSTADRVRTLGT